MRSRPARPVTLKSWLEKFLRKNWIARYCTEQALTVALMGLIAEETLIAQRLGKLGRKKPSPISAA